MDVDCDDCDVFGGEEGRRVEQRRRSHVFLAVSVRLQADRIRQQNSHRHHHPCK